MEQSDTQDGKRVTGEVVDFDEWRFNAFAPEDRYELLREAQLLASVFAPNGGAGDLRRMAAQLSAGERDAEIGRAHARRLAAALKFLEKAA